jgi:hypothetical protein
MLHAELDAIALTYYPYLGVKLQQKNQKAEVYHRSYKKVREKWNF